MLPVLFSALLAVPAGARERPKTPPKVELHLRSARPGEAVLIAVTGHEPVRPPSGTFAGAELPFHKASAGSWVALAGIDLEASTGALRLALDLKGPGGAREYVKDLMVRPKPFATRRLSVPPQYVDPGPELEARADAETKRMKDLFAARSPEWLIAGRFRMPVKGAKTTSRFGERSVFNGEQRSPHSGADIEASTGTRVLAPQAGRVALAEDFYFPGGTVVLDHGLGVYTLFAHLSKVSAPVGKVVKAGELVALAGATGRVTGPHLHWATRVHGARVDPTSLLALPIDRYLGRAQKRTKR